MLMGGVGGVTFSSEYDQFVYFLNYKIEFIIQRINNIHTKTIIDINIYNNNNQSKYNEP
jgi:hypothetical protein